MFAQLNHPRLFSLAAPSLSWLFVSSSICSWSISECVCVPWVLYMFVLIPSAALLSCCHCLHCIGMELYSSTLRAWHVFWFQQHQVQEVKDISTSNSTVPRFKGLFNSLIATAGASSSASPKISAKCSQLWYRCSKYKGPRLPAPIAQSMSTCGCLWGA